MPQLDVTNWFNMLLYSWLTLTITMLKTTNTIFPQKPTKKHNMSKW